MSIAEISRFVLRHKLLVVLVWVAVTVAGVAAAGPATEALSQRFDLPGRESTEVNTAIIERYGNGGFAAPYVAVVTLPEGTTIDSPGITDELAVAFARVAEAAPASATIAGAPLHLTGLSEGEAGDEEESNGALIETLVGAGGALIVLLWV